MTLATGRHAGAHLAGGQQGGLAVHAPWHRLKRWHYLSVAGETHFLALGLVHLGFVAQAFAYLVDHRSGARTTFEALSPLGLGLRMAPSPSRGLSRFRGGGGTLSMASGADGWELSADLPLGGRRLHGRVAVPYGDGVSLYFDHGRGRMAYTYKAADLPATAALRLDDEALALDDARAVVDWTRAHAPRHTRWRWASATGRLVDGTRVGLNLSTDVYDLDGVGQENTLWRDGTPRQLGAVALQPDSGGKGGWTLRSADGSADGALHLRFEPDSARRDSRDFGLVRSRFVQACGRFVGQVDGAPVAALYGVMEDHDALW